ncbi:MAG: hypothetical protein N2690_04030 [Rhodocyclaceae bacterium]|nr:hypothetical protein [Rhodocyclaceae bacterium]
MNAPIEIPAFLEKREPDAVYSWWSTGRLLILKDGGQVSLSRDDLAALRRFFDQFADKED